MGNGCSVDLLSPGPLNGRSGIVITLASINARDVALTPRSARSDAEFNCDTSGQQRSEDRERASFLLSKTRYEHVAQDCDTSDRKDHAENNDAPSERAGTSIAEPNQSKPEQAHGHPDAEHSPFISFLATDTSTLGKF